MRIPVSRLSLSALTVGLLGLAFAFQANLACGGECGCSACAGKRIAAGSAVCGPGFQLVERTIQVPTMVTERRVVIVTECRTEICERTVMVPKMIPETKQVRDTYTVMVPHKEVRVERYPVCVAAWREVIQDVTIQVPYQELRKETRRVCRQVQVEEQCSVTRDRGQWEEVLVDVAPACCSTFIGCGRGRRWLQACGGCGKCSSCRSIGNEGYDAGYAPAVAQQIQRVWKPNLVTEQVPVLVCHNEIVEEPYEYFVTVYQPEVRKQAVRVCERVFQEREREVEVTVCVPQKREAVRNVSTYRTVSEPQVQRYRVQVPYKVEKEIEVQVCRLVPKTVVCRVPAACRCECRD